MVLFGALACGLLLFVNRFIGGNLLYPPAFLAAVWTAALGGVWLAGDRFVPTGPESVGIFLMGSLAFSLGGALVMGLFGRRRKLSTNTIFRRKPVAIDRLLSIGLFVMVLYLPVRTLRLRELVERGAGEPFAPLTAAFWYAVRRGFLEEDVAGGTVGLLGLLDNVLVLSIFLAILAVQQDLRAHRTRARTIAIVVLAFFLQISTASRSSALGLVFGLVGAAWVETEKISIRGVILAGLGGAILFSMAAITVGQVGGSEDNPWALVRALFDSATFYLLSPIVAFDGWLQDPGAVEPSWFIGRSISQILARLGVESTLPSRHLEYVEVSSNEWMNVYTMYFAYVPHHGLLGTAVILFGLGVVFGICYLSARHGNPRARFLLTCTLGPLFMSIFNEQLLLNLSFYFKAYLFSLLVFGLPIGRSAFRRLVSGQNPPPMEGVWESVSSPRGAPARDRRE